MELESKSLSHGVGGSYTKWQREPPAHRVYQVDLPGGYTTIKVYAENRALDDPDHPTIQKIEDASQFKSEQDWSSLDDNTQNEIRTHLAEKVKTDEFFMD